jgi:hypothetical protein
LLALEQIIEICKQMAMQFPQGKDEKNHVAFSPFVRTFM